MFVSLMGMSFILLILLGEWLFFLRVVRLTVTLSREAYHGLVLG